ncbi:HAD family phosphatase [Roseburia hominis]
MLKNIIFDMGNVLLEYDPEVPLRAFCDSEEARNCIRAELFQGPEWVESDLGYLTPEGMFEKVSRRVPEKWHGALMRCTEEWNICMTPVAGARRFCDGLREEGYHLYVLSNASKDFYNYFPRFADLDYFDGVVVSADIHLIKPDPAIYRYLLETYHLIPEECLFIDDRPENVEAAGKLGIHGHVFSGDYPRIKEMWF